MFLYFNTIYGTTKSNSGHSGQLNILQWLIVAAANNLGRGAETVTPITGRCSRRRRVLVHTSPLIIWCPTVSDNPCPKLLQFHNLHRQGMRSSLHSTTKSSLVSLKSLPPPPTNLHKSCPLPQIATKAIPPYTLTTPMTEAIFHDQAIV